MLFCFISCWSLPLQLHQKPSAIDLGKAVLLTDVLVSLAWSGQKEFLIALMSMKQLLGATTATSIVLQGPSLESPQSMDPIWNLRHLFQQRCVMRWWRQWPLRQSTFWRSKACRYSNRGQKRQTSCSIIGLWSLQTDRLPAFSWLCPDGSQGTLHWSSFFLCSSLRAATPLDKWEGCKGERFWRSGLVIRRSTSRWWLPQRVRSREKHVALPPVHRYPRNLRSCTQSVPQSQNASNFCFASDWCYPPNAERSFLSMKLLKNYLRSIMKEDRLTNLALIYIHKDVEIKVDEVIDRFSAKNRILNFV